MIRRQVTVLAVAVCLGAAGCMPSAYRRQADRAAEGIIAEARGQALGQHGPLAIEPPADALRRRLLLGQGLPTAGPASVGADNLPTIPHWPEGTQAALVGPPARCEPVCDANRPVVLSLAEALQVAAANNRDYQSGKESVFRAALALDLRANEFRNLLFSDVRSVYSADHTDSRHPVRGLASTVNGSWEKKLRNGTLLSAAFAVDLVKMLMPGQAKSVGITLDGTVTVPLLRGAGEYVVAEPLTQAERDVIYSLHEFERFRRTLVVQVASDYLSVLQQQDAEQNAAENYRGLIGSTRRARRLADAGRLPQIQVDQALQDELRARDRWIAARQSYARRLDSFRITLGLPTDANVSLDRSELTRLASLLPPPPPALVADPNNVIAADAQIDLQPPTMRGAGPLEMPYERAIHIALSRRLDLRTALGEVYDAQRGVVVAADALKAGLTFTGTAAYGSRRTLAQANVKDTELNLSEGVYSAGLLLDLPLERTAERNAYRDSYITLQRSVRAVQSLEDQIKLQIRDALRNLLQARESYAIQAQAVVLARRRVDSTELFLQAGRAQIRDVLEAREALLSAQNALTAAVVSYRVAELELQRDMGVLEIDEKGNWREYQPADGN